MQTSSPAARSPRWVFWLLALYAVFLTLLPAGSIHGVNVKLPLFVPLTLAAFVYSLRQNKPLARVAMIGVFVAAFTGWAVLTSFYPFADTSLALAQYKDVLTTLAGCWIIRIFTQHPADRVSFIRVVVYAAGLGALIKVMLFVYSMRSGVPVSAISEGISSVFGVELMSVDVGDQSLRLQFVSDNLLPSCIFAVLCLRRRLRMGALVSVIIVALLLASSVYTFSRYLWAYTAVAVVLGILVSQRDWLHLLYIGAIVAPVAYLYQTLSTLIALRFSSNLADASDAIRVDQIRSLKAFFWDAPFFGHGLGSYTTDVIRSERAHYLYEVQILALCGQVGLVGMALFTALIVNYYRKAFSFRPGQWFYQGSVLMLLAFFLGAGFFNPTLLTSTAALTFGFLFVLASLGSCRETNEEAARVQGLPAPMRSSPSLSSSGLS